MPILRVEIVEVPGWTRPPDLAQRIANLVGQALSAPAQSVWIRLSTIAAADYAENGTAPADAAPVFVTILEKSPPDGEALTAEIAALTAAIAEACDRAPGDVHLIYEPPGRGRVSFGGRLLT